jgi:nitroreductase
MDIQQAIRDRRSIRRFQQKAIPEEALVRLVEAGVWAPSGGNAQTWIFVIINEQSKIEQVKAISPGLLGDPTALIAVCQDKDLAHKRGGELGRDTLSVMDAAIASQNIALQASAEGLGSCLVLSFHEKGIQKLLNLPEHIVPELLITLGYPAESPRPPKRRLKEVTFFNEYKVQHGK